MRNCRIDGSPDLLDLLGCIASSFREAEVDLQGEAMDKGVHGVVAEATLLLDSNQAPEPVSRGSLSVALSSWRTSGARFRGGR